jgi:hypothetical protein
VSLVTYQKVGKVFKELTQSYQILFDYAKFVKILDIEFMKEIKKAHRVPETIESEVTIPLSIVVFLTTLHLSVLKSAS